MYALSFAQRYYDAQNRPAIVEWNNGVTTAKYAYIQNLQGDIVGIVDSNGTEVVKYTYDAWGKVLSTTGSLASTLGTIQPFRYRGYAYDVETGLYYLRSRYYSSILEKFLNADSVIKENLFRYCNNNPISRNDNSGKDSESILNDILQFITNIAENQKELAIMEIERQNEVIRTVTNSVAVAYDNVKTWCEETALPWLNTAIITVINTTKDIVASIFESFIGAAVYTFEDIYTIVSQIPQNGKQWISQNIELLKSYSYEISSLYTGSALFLEYYDKVYMKILTDNQEQILWIIDALMWIYTL